MKDFYKLLENYEEQLHNIGIIEIMDIPTIDLYMDQVTTFIDSGLWDLRRFETDKVLTKTMINNYAKAKIFPPPLKKKYTKNHIMLLILIYHLKFILSISDISLLLKPVTDELNKNSKSYMLDKIYDAFVKLQKGEHIDENIYICEKSDKIELIISVLNHCMLANAQKRLAEKMLDTYFKIEKEPLKVKKQS